MLELEPVDLAALARAAADGSEGVLLRESDGLVSIEGDARRLTQLLLALVRAAAFISAEGVPVQLGVTDDPDTGTLEVRAPRLEAVDGHGSGAAGQDRRQAALGSRAGIDLALAQAIALDHGGRLEIELEESGTTFRARFPAPVAAPSRTAPAGRAVRLL